MAYVYLLLFIIVAAIAAFLLDRLGLWLERKGYIYYRKSNHTPSAGVGNALFELHSMFESELKNPSEIKQEIKHEQTQSEDPPFDASDDPKEKDRQDPAP